MSKIKLVVGAFASILIILLFAPQAMAQSSAIDFDNLEVEQTAPWGIGTLNRANEYLDTIGVNRFNTGGWTIEENSGRIYVGGKFPHVVSNNQTISHPWIAAFDVNTGEYIPSFRPQTDGVIFSLENAPDGDIFVGGEFSTWNGRDVDGLVKIDPITGQEDPNFRIGLIRDDGRPLVRDLYVGHDDLLYVGGTFDQASDPTQTINVNSVFRINMNTNRVGNRWTPDIDFRAVWGVALSQVEDNVYVVGRTDETGLGQRGGPEVSRGVEVISRSNSSIKKWNGFQVNRDATWIYDVETTSAGTVFFAGTEHGVYVHDERRNFALVNNHVTGRDLRFDQGQFRAGGDYQDLEVIGDSVVGSCHCWGAHSSNPNALIRYFDARNQAGGASFRLDDIPNATHTGNISAIAVYDARTGVRNQNFNPHMAGNSGGWAVHGDSNGCLWLTGGIDWVGLGDARQAARELVRFCGTQQNNPAPTPTPTPIAAPASCTVTISGENVNVSWARVAAGEDYIVQRTVDGSQPFWRGVSASTTFVDTNRDAELAYSIITRRGNDRSQPTDCGTPAVGPPPVTGVPTNCSFTITGDNIRVDWTGAQDASRYVIYRSVDGSAQFWRGTETGTTFNDTLRGESLEYQVLAVFADDSRSQRVPCDQAAGNNPAPAPIEDLRPVSSCTVQPNGNNIQVNWTTLNNPDAEYMIARRVDGSRLWWRGRVDGNSFTDTSRSGTLEYSINVVLGDQRATWVACTPTLRN